MPIGSIRLWLGRLLLAVLAANPIGLGAQRAPSPEQFFGFKMGAERRLAPWNRIVEYLRVLDKESDRLVVQDAGTTTGGRPYLLAILSTPDTLANLDAFEQVQKRLADPRRTTWEEADRLARDGKAVVLIGMNVHSNEIGGSQMANDLIYRLATEKSPWVDHVLRNLVVLVIPSENPDGEQMVVDWYARNLDTPYEDSPLPELYHPVGHDNNRDSYMLTQVETRILNRITYREWLPEVYLDVHQMDSTRARIFVPPYKRPANPNVDPLVWSQIDILAQAMSATLYEAGKTGIIWGDQYSGFWQGANNTTPWWHNIVSLLTETASAGLATRIVQDVARPGTLTNTHGPAEIDLDRLEPRTTLPAPTDIQPRTNYAHPWLGGSWSPADVVEYEALSTYGLLEAAASHREMLKRNFYLMNKRTIEQYAAGGPYAFVVPGEQRDPAAVAKLLSIIQAEAGEVHRAEAPFIADGREFPAGTSVILLAQPFGRWIKDLLEPQVYPDVRGPDPGAPVDAPYDVAAWSLGMLMGVETIEIESPFTARLQLLTTDVEAPAGTVAGRGSIFIIGHEANNSIVAMNRLLRIGAEIEWARDELTIEGHTYGPGAIVVKNVGRERLEAVARDLKVNVRAITDKPGEGQALAIRAPRVAVFEIWGGATDAGWTRWLFDQYELPFTHIRNADVVSTDLRGRFDVIVFPEMPALDIVRGLQGPHVTPEQRGGIGQAGVRNLRRFVEAGGTIITLGNSAQFAIQQLGVPVRNGVHDLDPATFFCPGSILKAEVDIRHPVGYGLPAEADVMFFNNVALVPASASAGASTVIARYPQRPLLRSGLLIGESRLQGTAASLEVTIGNGRVIMHGFRVQHRGQAWGTFKLLFNSIYYGAALAPVEPIPVLEAVDDRDATVFVDN